MASSLTVSEKQKLEAEGWRIVNSTSTITMRKIRAGLLEVYPKQWKPKNNRSYMWIAVKPIEG